MTLLLLSCATPYRALKHQTGYSDRPLGNDEHEVTFLGNADTTYDQVVDFALLRSAEIALQQHARSFTILDVMHLSSARRYLSAPQYFEAASPYLSSGGNTVPSAPEFPKERSYAMVVLPQERVFYRPGVRLRIRLLAEAPPGGPAYDPARISEQIKRKYRLK